MNIEHKHIDDVWANEAQTPQKGQDNVYQIGCIRTFDRNRCDARIDVAEQVVLRC